jgi:GlpG protein
MRIIGYVKNEASARTLGDYLTSLDIRNQVESDEEGWAVWIHSEDQLDTGREALKSYLQNPDDPKYKEAARKAAAVESKERREKAKFEKRFRTRDQIFSSSNRCPITIALIVISVIVTAAANLPASPVHWLLMTDLLGGGLMEIQHGQFWRLLTPIFIHSGILHLFFDMYWLFILGSMIETRKGPLTLLLLVVIIGIGSNLGQYYWFDAASIGMSGVGYGLFGYIWLRGNTDPTSGFYLQPSTVWVMLIWFFLCWFGMVGDIANGAHTVGLMMGMLWGVAPIVKRFV